MNNPLHRACALALLSALAASLPPGASLAQAGPSPGAAQTSSVAAVVKIRSGRLQGLSDGVTSSFKAIPYAAPPIGDLRWRPPQPVKAWSGVRAADKLGAICQQKYNAGDNGVGAPPLSEDCLTLNVWAPAKASKTPVMVWIHGGGFANGSGTAALYDGQALARQGVVVVTLNYRLGRFGFFAHPSLADPASNEAIGNYGLMDIIAALTWVRDNIARFGGDPAQVTIFGESAGGAAVNAMMVSPLARGLFARAIVESGLGREPAATRSQALESGKSFAAKLGLANATAQQLRALSAEAIVAAGDIEIFKGDGPMLDGQLLTERPAEAFAKGHEAPTPYIVGWNSLEFPAPAQVFEASQAANPKFTAEAKTRLITAYPDAQAYADHVASDFLFVEPAVNLARLHARNGHPTYVYQFSVLSKAAPAVLKGAPHAVERGYVFKTLQTSPWPVDANDTAQAEAMSGYWASFAKTGVPSVVGQPAWPRLEQASERIIDFTNTGPQVTAIPRAQGLDTLQSLNP